MRSKRSLCLCVGALCSLATGAACGSFASDEPAITIADDAQADGPATLVDASFPVDAGGGAMTDAVVDGDALAPAPLGSPENPASSCKALRAARATAPSGGYSIAPPGGPAFVTYCDMTVAGGGWTKVTPTMPQEVVDTLRGGAAMGRQLLKCLDSGTDYLESPSFNNAWQWAGATMIAVPGPWITNGVGYTCGSLNEYAGNGCTNWWGVGCGNGAGSVEKLYPGVLGAAPAGDCQGVPKAHANGNFAVCGTTNYGNYSIFVRAD